MQSRRRRRLPSRAPLSPRPGRRHARRARSRAFPADSSCSSLVVSSDITRTSIFISIGIATKEKRYAVSELRHAAEEEAPFRVEERALDRTAAELVAGVREEGHRRGDV